MKIKKINNKLKITFQYNPILIRKVKTLNDRKYNPTEKTWYCPDTKQNRDKLIKWGFDLEENYLATEIISNLTSNKPMKMVISNKLTIRHAPFSLINELKELLTIPNPKWIENERMGRWNMDTPQKLEFFEIQNNKFIIPKALFPTIKTNAKIIDKRIKNNVSFTFHGTLKPYQEIAQEKVLKHDFCTLASPTGSGKTVMALSIIAKRNQKTLIIVHTKELLKQWIERINTFLKIKNVGQIGDGKKIVGKEITVGMVQTLYNYGPQIADQFGFIVIDECHRTPSRAFTTAVQMFNSYYVLGLSATLYRRDGLSKLIYWYVGPCVHEIKEKELTESGDILPLEIIWKETEFISKFNPVDEYTKVLSEMTKDVQRNMLICKDVNQEIGNGICLLLSDRKEHCIVLQKMLMYEFNIYSDILTGDSNKKERGILNKNLDKNNVSVLIATSQLIGEGYDLPALSSLFLCTPIRYKGRLIQYVGRVRRPSPGKKVARVFDYVDNKIEIFVRNANFRKNIYKKI